MGNWPVCPDERPCTLFGDLDQLGSVERPFLGLVYSTAYSGCTIGLTTEDCLPRFLIAAKDRSLATFFNIQINRLADRFIMEIEENVNGGEEKGRFSQIPF